MAKEIANNEPVEHDGFASSARWVASLLIALTAVYSNAGIVVEPPGNPAALGILISVDDLGDEIVSGFKLHITWDAGPDDIEVDFWGLPWGTSLGPGGAATGSSLFQDLSCDIGGAACVPALPGGSNFLTIEAMSLNTDAEIMASQQPIIAANGGVLRLLDLVLASNMAIGPLFPDNLQVSATIYGKGGKVIAAVPEPSTVGLFGLGLLAVGLGRRRVQRLAAA